MPYTVSHGCGLNTDADFEVYARLLRQRGVDLGKLPRAPEPETGRRWLYVWDSKEDADAFAEELNRRTMQEGWSVMEVGAVPSEGPLGPILVQVGRRSDGLAFALHPLSRSMIESAFPQAKVMASTVFIRFETLQDFQATHGSLEDLAREVVPLLTGLKPLDLETLGYAVIEDGSHRTLVFERPGDLASA